MTTTRRRSLLAGLLLAAALLIAAVALGASAPAATTPGATTLAARFVPGPCAQPPGETPELKTARCGRLLVPEDRAHPNSKTISLSVAIIPAKSKNPKPDPIVWLAGGP